MAFNYSVMTSDPAAGDAQHQAVIQAANTALGVWSQYLSGVGTLLVQLNFAPQSTNFIASGGPTTETYVGTSNGRTLYQSSAANEMKTGSHAAGSDITVTFNTAYLSPVTQGFDLVQVLEHELMHGFGAVGFRSGSGALGSAESTGSGRSAPGRPWCPGRRYLPGCRCRAR